MTCQKASHIGSFKTLRCYIFLPKHYKFTILTDMNILTVTIVFYRLTVTNPKSNLDLKPFSNLPINKKHTFFFSIFISLIFSEQSFPLIIQHFVDECSFIKSVMLTLRSNHRRTIRTEVVSQVLSR